MSEDEINELKIKANAFDELRKRFKQESEYTFWQANEKYMIKKALQWCDVYEQNARLAVDASLRIGRSDSQIQNND